MSLEERRAISRLIHRVGFGPKPGEFEELLSLGFAGASQKLLNGPSTYKRIQSQDLGLRALGEKPKPNTPEIVEYAEEKRFQLRKMTLWWLDQMTNIDNPIAERMTWFWHGHWATSFAKVDEPIFLFEHVQKLRKHSLGNFKSMAREMVLDAALILWLDGQKNTATAPNENLSRELMELFILGVNRYSEADVKESAKALTGYKVDKRSGEVSRNSRQSFQGSIKVLGRNGSFDANSLVDLLVEQKSCQKFIPERLWFRMVSSSNILPDASSVEQAFNSRDIKSAVSSIVNHPGFQAAENSQVKSPVEWLVAILRAARITPSQFEKPDYLINLLNSLGQKPFFPPNVGGWPADEAWLSAASAQTRIAAAQYLVKRADLTTLTDLRANSRIEGLANWLGVANWSQRTKLALDGAVRDPQRLVILGVCSPEFMVNA